MWGPLKSPFQGWIFLTPEKWALWKPSGFLSLLKKSVHFKWSVLLGLIDEKSGPFISTHPPKQAKSVGCVLNFILRGPSFRATQGKATLPETNITEPLRIKGWNTNFLLGRPIFTGYVSIRECNHLSRLTTDLQGVELLGSQGENYRYKPRKPMLAERLGGWILFAPKANREEATKKERRKNQGWSSLQFKCVFFTLQKRVANWLIQTDHLKLA